ncbi:MAG TPA: toll/interleukin-1 receptor domain-containing protein [Anaerolineales bacterium]|nr:toll/interleukin-1 receptor domain-containing protein [Anaerolineales bacterium]HNC09755.1 toll/interleukin-1 receptor domain-containing protein [Anaerolineales bacterium]
MSQAFISYSRKDKIFVQKLQKALTDEKRDVWVDWEDIPPTAKWLREIYDGIEAAENFIFIISPDSLASKPCRMEIEHAVKHNKRFVPLLVREPGKAEMPEAVSIHNWIYFNVEADFEKSFMTLLSALDTDLDYIKTHTRLLIKALEWNTYNQDMSYLLSGSELTQASQWLKTSDEKSTKALPLHKDFIQASLKAEKESLDEKQTRQKYLSIRDTLLQNYIRPYLNQRKEELEKQREKLSKDKLLKFSTTVMALDEELSSLLNFLDLGGKWHPQEAISIRNLGPQEDYLEVFQFPCCGKEVLADKTPSRFRSDGCADSPMAEK